MQLHLRWLSEGGQESPFHRSVKMWKKRVRYYAAQPLECPLRPWYSTKIALLRSALAFEGTSDLLRGDREFIVCAILVYESDRTMTRTRSE